MSAARLVTILANRVDRDRDSMRCHTCLAAKPIKDFVSNDNYTHITFRLACGHSRRLKWSTYVEVSRTVEPARR